VNSPAPEAPRGGAAGSSDERLQTIGHVVRSLQPEFPDLSISKVRYLEDRGLVMPRRTAGGYRKYAPQDVRRLRAILTLQRDEFLPLEVIRERIERPTGSTGAAGGGRALGGKTALFASPAALQQPEERSTWDEAFAEGGVGEVFLRQLAEFRLIEAGPSTSPTISAADAEIAQICDLFARYGVEPRNLRVLLSSAEREAALLSQALAPSLRSPHAERREEGVKLLQEFGGLLSRLLDLLLYKELRRLVQ
jgi:DNA-binding transcriptional MerR regulator